MAKREISSRLSQMKFMQKAKVQQLSAEKAVEEEQKVSSEQWVAAAAAAPSTAKCVVIMEGDPSPSAPLGRMSFGNFNPNVEKLSAEIEELQKMKQRAASGGGAAPSISDAEMAARLKPNGGLSAEEAKQGRGDKQQGSGSNIDNEKQRRQNNLHGSHMKRPAEGDGTEGIGEASLQQGAGEGGGVLGKKRKESTDSGGPKLKHGTYESGQQGTKVSKFGGTDWRKLRPAKG